MKLLSTSFIISKTFRAEAPEIPVPTLKLASTVPPDVSFIILLDGVPF